MTGPRYSQAGVQALKHGVAAYRVGDRIVPARQAERLLEAVEALPPRHHCAGVGSCEVHPKWRVFKYSPLSRLWFAVRPFGKVSFLGPGFRTHAEAIRYATSRARAEQLAAVQSAEGVTAR